MKKKIIFSLFFCFAFLVFFASCSKSPTSPDIPGQVNKPKSETKNATGFLQILLKDNPVENAQNIFVTIGKIEVHKASPENFIAVSEDEQTLDLLELKTKLENIVNTLLEAGHYNQIRISVISGKITLSENGESTEYNMQIPSNKVKIPVQFEIEQNGITQITLDFDAEKSIHVTKAGKNENFILRPVILVEKVSTS